MVPNYHRSSLKSLVSLCLCCQSAILTYKRAFLPLNLLYCTCPASKDSISPNYYNTHTHTYSNTHAHTKHTWGNIPQGKSSISFMAFSGKVSSSPIKRLHSTLLLLFLLHSLSYISICISFGSHLRTIHSGQLTSTIFPFSLFLRGIIGANWRVVSLPRRYEIRLLQLAFRCVLNLPVSSNKPEAGGSSRKNALNKP